MHKLPDISEVSPLSEADAPLIADLVDVLRKHNALDRFGISLLHQHFDIAEDEVLVEATNVESRTQTIAPVRTADVKHLPAIDTAWRLDSGKAVMSCKCIKMGSHTHLPRPSDHAIKQNMHPISNALGRIMALRPIRFRYAAAGHNLRLPSTPQLGLLARDVEAMAPELVSECGRMDDGTPIKAVDYIGLVPVLVAALQEQQRQLDDIRVRQ